jgi:hypothetical protein
MLIRIKCTQRQSARTVSIAITRVISPAIYICLVESTKSERPMREPWFPHTGICPSNEPEAECEALLDIINSSTSKQGKYDLARELMHKAAEPFQFFALPMRNARFSPPNLCLGMHRAHHRRVRQSRVLFHRHNRGLRHAKRTDAQGMQHTWSWGDCICT